MESRNNKIKNVDIDNEERNKILNEKRSEIYKFFSNKKSLIFLIITVLSFIFALYNVLSEWFTSTLGFEEALIDIATLVLAALIPVALSMIYNASKKEDPELIENGFKMAKRYFVIAKVLLIMLSAVTAVVFFLMLPRITFGLFLGMVFIIIVYVIGFYLVKIFRDYIDGLISSVKTYRVKLPSSKKIVIYLFVVLILSVILYLIVLIQFDNIIQSLSVYAESLGYTAIEVEELQQVLEVLRISLYLNVGIALLIESYIIYYFNSYDKVFISYNKELRKKVKTLRESEYIDYKKQ